MTRYLALNNFTPAPHYLAYNEQLLVLLLFICLNCIYLKSRETKREGETDRERQRQRERDLPPSGSLPNAHKHWGVDWASAREPRTHSRCFSWVAGTQADKESSLFVSHSVVYMSRKHWKRSQISNPDTQYGMQLLRPSPACVFNTNNEPKGMHIL